MTSTYALQTARDVIFTTETIAITQGPQGGIHGITSYQNTFETLSQTKSLFKIQLLEVILTRKPNTIWPLINSNLINPNCHGTDYFLQITIPNALRPMEIGDLNKSNIFAIIDLRELYDSNAPQTKTFADFVPIIYRFYDPPPTAFFNSFESSFTTMDLQLTNSLNLDHPILQYANFKFKCHVEGVNYALSRGSR